MDDDDELDATEDNNMLPTVGPIRFTAADSDTFIDDGDDEPVLESPLPSLAPANDLG